MSHQPMQQAQRQPPISQLRKSADRIGRTIAGELAKLIPVERRELMVQTAQWLGERVAEFDQFARGTKQTVTPAIVTAASGKGHRGSDTAA